MIPAFRRVWGRFADLNARIDLPGGEIAGTRGRVEGLVAVQNRIRVAGKVSGRRVTLETAEEHSATRTAPTAGPAPWEFDFNLPLTYGPVFLTFEIDGETRSQIVFDLPPSRMRAARRRCLGPFAVVLAKSVPDVVRVVLRQDPAAKNRIKARFIGDRSIVPLADPDHGNGPGHERARRIRAVLAEHRCDAPLKVFFAHSWAGGAESWLRGQLSELLSDPAEVVVVIRVGGALRWTIELHRENEVLTGATDDFALIETLLADVPSRSLVYSCGAGDSDPVSLPDHVRRLAAGPPGRSEIEVLLHDFYPLSPSANLLDADGSFQGVPPADSRDAAHQTHGQAGRRISLAEWRRAWGALLQEAGRVVVYSPSSRELLLQAYPECADRVALRPHGLRKSPQILRSQVRADPPVLGVLGSITYPKGAAVLGELSQLLHDSGAGRIVVIGRTDPAWPLVEPSIVHGRYTVEDIAPLARSYGIGLWLIPSIWPETFSYTTHEALATGLPVWCFDLGAQADAVGTAIAAGKPGRLLPTGGGLSPAQAVHEVLLRGARSDDQHSRPGALVSKTGKARYSAADPGSGNRSARARSADRGTSGFARQ